MTITLNNNRESFDVEALTVSGLLEVKKFTFKMLIVKINGNFIKKEDYPVAAISEGDDVSVLHLISGG
jgi:sulfur carrier protein